jgi:hypothetical protein
MLAKSFPLLSSMHKARKEEEKNYISCINFLRINTFRGKRNSKAANEGGKLLLEKFF